jgi:hypothetical protein
MLTLHAALAASVLQRPDLISAGLEEAARLAERVPDDLRGNWQYLSATNVAIWRKADFLTETGRDWPATSAAVLKPFTGCAERRTLRGQSRAVRASSSTGPPAAEGGPDCCGSALRCGPPAGSAGGQRRCDLPPAR